jgi:hypothetical protein
MEKNLNIKSSTIEKGLEVAKDFVDKLIMPSIEEAGLLVKDHITMWRFKNQVRMLNKAKYYCEIHKIEPKKISLKVLAPLLEYSSLEEEEVMQDKWSILLSNLIDSQQNIENHVFPYILSQLSKDEFFPLENVYNSCIIRRLNFSTMLNKFITEDKPTKEKEIKIKLGDLEKRIITLKETEINSWSPELWRLKNEKGDMERDLKNLEYEEHKIKFSINKSEVVPDDLFREFEISNLIRLGLVKEVREFYAESQTLEIPLDRGEEYGYTKDYANIDLDIDVDSTTEYILTELGELFFKACKEKNN